MTEHSEEPKSDEIALANRLRRTSYGVMLVSGLPWIIHESLATDIVWGAGFAAGIGGVVVANVFRNHLEEENKN